MAIEIDESNPGYLTVRLSGKLVAEDYEHFVPAVEKIVEERGKVRLLLEMRDFHDIERLAMVGEKAWQHGMAVFCKPFTKAAVQYFDVAEADKARSWIESD